MPTWSMWLPRGRAPRHWRRPARGSASAAATSRSTRRSPGQGGSLAYSTIAAGDLAAGRLVRLFSLSLTDLFAYYIVHRPRRPRPPQGQSLPRLAAAGGGRVERTHSMICDVHAHYTPKKFSEFMGDRFASPCSSAGQARGWRGTRSRTPRRTSRAGSS